MQQYSKQTHNSVSNTLYLVMGCFILVQVVFFMHNFHPYLNIALKAHTDFNLPKIVFADIIYFFIAQLALYIVFTGLTWLLIRGVLLAFPRYQKYHCQITIAITLLVTANVLWANQYYYPSSQFSLLLTPWLSATTIQIIFYTHLALLGLCITNACYAYLRTAPRSTLCVLVLLSLAGILIYHNGLDTHINRHHNIHAKLQPKAHNPATNVILIGIDSLRPDHVEFFGSPWTHTPHLDTFLQQAITFKQAYTPYGRTYPSWVSILTGLYPPHHGARYNLINPNKIHHLEYNLASLLQQHGYQTLYATDENRFSNIDQRFYFDHIIGPKMGFNDFLLGSANDFPLSNLIINSHIGHWLFPYTYANRAASATYNPHTFINLLNRSLNQLTPHKPTLLAVHLCLPHWPYLWQQSVSDTPNSTQHMQALYRKAINRVDVQFENLINVLKQHQLLGNAWVVVLSDHAEGLALKKDLLINQKNYLAGPKSDSNLLSRLDHSKTLKYGLQFSAGHGTNVLSPIQFQPLLAIRGYGSHQTAAHVMQHPVSLLDIKVTLADLLGLVPSHQDGFSLKSSVLQGAEPPHPRNFYFESGLLIDAIKTTHPNLATVIKQGLGFYKIDPYNGHLVIRDNKDAYISNSKQYAIYRTPWLLAYYPISPQRTLHILVNVKQQQWTDDLSLAWAQQAPLAAMRKALQQMYYHA